MKLKSDKFWIIVFGITVLVCMVAALPAGILSGSVAHIYSNGELVDTVMLYDVREEYLLTVDNSLTGGVNVIEVKHGQIRVVEANCDDKTCVRRGWSSSRGMPIICLPNNLVIQLEGDSDIDAVAG